MYILLTAATSFEIDPTLALLEKSEFNFNDHEIEVLITGIGQAPTTYLLTYNLQNKRPDLVIQAGIAGSFTNELLLGQTVFIKQLFFFYMFIVITIKNFDSIEVLTLLSR